MTTDNDLRVVHCPGCRGRYKINPAKIPQGGAQLTCAACGKRWLVQPSAAHPAPDTSTATPQQKLVTCPSCNHEFQPNPASAALRPILIVDDQEFFRNFAVDLLAERFDTHVAKSTTEALRKVDEVDPALIILDLGLEGGPEDGLGILTRLGGRIPVLIMTGRDESEMFQEWEKFKALGARDLVIKSLNLGDELAEKVDQVLSGASRH